MTQTEPLFAIDNVDDMLLKRRTQIRDVWNEVFNNLPESCLICISGSEGKSLMCQEIMARIMTLFKGLSNAEILFCEIQQNFRISTLAGFLSKRQIDPKINREDLLDKLTYQCFDIKHSFKTFIKDIKNEIKSNPMISAVVIDCFGHFYNFAPRQTNETGFGLTHQFFFNQIIEQFKIISKNYKVTFIYTQPHYFQFKSEDRFSDYWIDIEKKRLKSESTRSMKIKNRTTGEIRKANFVIKNHGIEILKISKYEDDKKPRQSTGSTSYSNSSYESTHN
jgi:hypothetical protein